MSSKCNVSDSIRNNANSTCNAILLNYPTRSFPICEFRILQSEIDFLQNVVELCQYAVLCDVLIFTEKKHTRVF